MAKLKAKGLVSARVDARAQKPTRHMQNQVKRFGDVLSGKAQVVRVPKRGEAREFSERFDTKGKYVVVPGKQGRLSYSKKTGEIHRTVYNDEGERLQFTYSSKPVSNARDLPEGKIYQIEHGGAWTFDDLGDLEDFMRSAENSGWKNWAQYVQVVEA